MTTKMMFDSIVDIERRQFARVHARDIIKALDGCCDPEAYLAYKLDVILQAYTGGLEQIAKRFEQLAHDAIMLQSPPIMIVKDK